MDIRKATAKKMNVTITIDDTLFNELDSLRTKEKIKSLSPIINELLWDWLENYENKTKEATKK